SGRQRGSRAGVEAARRTLHDDRSRSPARAGGQGIPQNGPGLTDQVGDRARRRITRRLIPFLLLLYLLAYIDRSNLSVAKLQMQGELNFTDEIIGFGVGIFFVGYFLLEIP